MGAVDYITKPIHKGEALARISVSLSLRCTYINLMKEVAERRQAEQVLQATLDKLKQAQASLVQTAKMVGLGQILAGIAHEINNSVSSIYLWQYQPCQGQCPDIVGHCLSLPKALPNSFR